MRVLILADIKKKHILQQIITWGNSNSGISYQMFFPKNVKMLNYILKASKHDIIVTTNLKIATELSRKNITPVIIDDKDFNDFSQLSWVKK
jgi:hypothetical protein